MPHKSWSTMTPPREKSISFTLNDQSFDCLDEIPAYAYTRLNSWTTTTGSAVSFIECCLIDDDAIERFQRVIASRSHIVSKDDVADIMSWLVEQYSERPTQSPTGSAPGPQERSNGSVGDSSSAAFASRT